MELLCIFAALAVLFLFCAFLTLKCNLHAALAPLSALGIAVAWLTAAGMANLLLPGTVLLWAVFAGSGVWVLVPHKGQRPAYRRLVTPGAVLFWGMALAFAVYFFIRQPLATKYDELSLWATAVKVTKADNRLYALATLGTPWPQTQNPGLPLLSYFFQFLGHYADWKIYVAYDVLAAAVFAAVLGGLNFRQYRIAVPLAAICWFAPWFLTVYNHTIYLDTTYMTAYGDVPAGLALGGAVALWLALRKTGGTLMAGSTLTVHEKIMTTGDQHAVTDFDVDLNGEGCSANVVSRSVAKDVSKQEFISHINGNCACAGHSECDAIIMDHASVIASPALTANSVDASLIHEAAIGKIAGEQLIKLMTLGLTEKEAEDQIVNGFLK